MNGCGFALCLLLTLLLGMPSLLSADEAASLSPSLEPLEIIEDCLQALQTRDFARYVDHDRVR